MGMKKDMKQLQDDPGGHGDIIIELQKRLKSALRQSTQKILKLQSKTKRPCLHKKTGVDIVVPANNVASTETTLDESYNSTPKPPRSNGCVCTLLLYLLLLIGVIVVAFFVSDFVPSTMIKESQKISAKDDQIQELNRLLSLQHA